MTTQEKYQELSFYTLSHQDDDFIHQHIVDAFLAQTATEHTKPITIFFALAGLYLFVEKNYTGKQVQGMHGKMAERKKEVINIIPPTERGAISVADVLNVPPGTHRDEMIKEWCISVWHAYADQHDTIISLTERLLEDEELF